MNGELFQRIVAQIEQIDKSKPSVHLQGWGEPLLHPATISHIRQLKSAGVAVSFTSNGTIMDKALAESLINAGLDGLTFSMAGNSRSTQEKLRGIGSFDLLRSSIQTFIEARTARDTQHPNVAVSYLLTPETAGELPGAVSWCSKIGVDAFVTVHLTQAGGKEQRNLQFLMSKKEAQHFQSLRIKTQTRALFRKMRLDLRTFQPTLTAVCDKNPLNSLFISAVGDVSPCVFLCPPVNKEINWYYKELNHSQAALCFGNIRDSSLAEIWDNPAYREFRETFRKRAEYHDRKLSRVNYSAAGSVELEAAVKAITTYFSSHPPPKACSACAKMDGF